MQQDNEAALQALSGIFPSQSVIALCYPAYLLNGDNATETQIQSSFSGCLARHHLWLFPMSFPRQGS